MRRLYDEVFAREVYLFESSTTQPVIFDRGANIGMATLFFQVALSGEHGPVV
jgi:hypothetical protein